MKLNSNAFVGTLHHVHMFSLFCCLFFFLRNADSSSIRFSRFSAFAVSLRVFSCFFLSFHSIVDLIEVVVVVVAALVLALFALVSNQILMLKLTFVVLARLQSNFPKFRYKTISDHSSVPFPRTCVRYFVQQHTLHYVVDARHKSCISRDELLQKILIDIIRMYYHDQIYKKCFQITSYLRCCSQLFCAF